MKLSQTKKILIFLLSIFFLTSLTSLSSVQPNRVPNSQPSDNQRVNSTEKTASDATIYNLKEAVRISQRDGSQRVVPVITGEVLWWVILTVLSGTLIAISVVVMSGAYAHRNSQSGGKNQFLTEALPTLIEGITIVYIILAILLLSVLGITSAEGTLSILAGISGYVLGKERSSKSAGKDKLSPKDET